MANWTVKRKVRWSTILFALAVLTFVLSWARLFPANFVEKRFAGGVFPTISHITGWLADAVPFSWLDAALITTVALLVYSYRRQNLRILLGAASAAYLWAFWTWGLNYHRVPLAARLHLDTQSLSRQQTDEFVQTAASELNRLWPIVAGRSHDPAKTAEVAARRIHTVFLRIDGTDRQGASRIKQSILADGWLRIATIDGLFNPFGHEPIVASSLLSFELPFVMT